MPEGHRYNNNNIDDNIILDPECCSVIGTIIAEAIDLLGSILYKIPMINMQETPTENTSLKHGT